MTDPRRSVALATAGVGASVVFVLTWPWGLGASNDSATYLSVARSLANGTGFVRFNGEPFAAWPPLYPMAMAPWLALGLTPMGAARIVNTACFGLTVGVTAATLGRLTESVLWTVFGALLLVLNPDLVQVFGSVWSEALMTAMGACLLLLVARGERRLAPLAVVAGLAVLSRYVAVAWLPPVAAWLALRGRVAEAPVTDSPVRRLAPALVFLAVAPAGLLAWMARNAVSTATLFGRRHDATQGVVENLGTFLDSLGSVLCIGPSPGRAWCGGAFLVAVVVLGVIDRRPAVRVAASFVAIYVAVLVGLASRTTVSDLDGRFLAPVVPPSVVILVASLARVRAVQWARAAIPVCVVLELLRFGQFAQGAVAYGLGDFGNKSWRRSPVIKALRAADPPGQLVSNASPAIWIYLERASHESAYWHPWGRPQIDTDANEMLRDAIRQQPDGQLTLVWFEHAVSTERHESPAEMRAAGFVLDPIWEGRQGGIYTVTAPPP